MYNVASYLRTHATERPDQAALRFPAAHYKTAAPAWDTWTYAELDRESDCYARGFREVAGITAGERVVVLMKPSLRFYAAMYGLFKLGAVPVLLDPGMGAKALMACIAQIKPTAMLALSPVHAVSQVFRAPFASVTKRITDGRRWFWGGHTLAQCRRESPAPFWLVERDGDQDAALIFTSGSTGTPKPVVNRLAMFAAQVDAIREMLRMKPGDTLVEAFAAFALFDLSWGHTCVIPHMNLAKPATADPADIAAAIQTFEAKKAFASPIVWQRVLRWCEETGTHLDSLEMVVTVGAPIPAYLHQRFQKFLAWGTQIHTPYGATEGMPVTEIATSEILDLGPRTDQGEGTPVGRLAPGISVRIIHVTDDPIPEWSPEIDAQPGEIGEICISGEQVSREYRDLHEANTKAKIRDGDWIWHRMGDLGRFDQDGRLWFCGRKAHRLETPQGLIPNVPVENVYNRHPDVFRSALVGVGPRGREVPVLCVELEAGKSWSPAVQTALEGLAKDSAWDGVVKRFLPHAGFPTDARHNSKIRNEDLKVWATAQCPDLAAEVSR